MIKSLVLITGALAALSASQALGQPSTNQAGTTNAAARPAVKASDLFGDALVAKGRGVEVKRGKLDDEVIRRKAALAGYGQTVPPERMNELERQVLDQLIAFQLLLAKATDADKTKGKEQFENSIKTYKADKK